MLATLVRKTFVRATQGEITEDEAADQIADALCTVDSSCGSTNYINGFQVVQNNAANDDDKVNTVGNLEQQLQQPQQQQQGQKILGTITLGDLQPAQIAQLQQAFAEASKGLSSPFLFNVPTQMKNNPEDVFTDDDKERCALLQELITGQRPLILHPYVFLLNRRFKFTDIAVPVTDTDKFRIYRLNQARNARCYYRCSGCETMAKLPGDPIAQIKLAEGHLAGDVNPIHNPKCELFSVSAIVNRQFDREARLDIYNGVMSPEEAWKRGRMRALRAEKLAPKGLINADEYPSWETMNKIIMKLWRTAKRAHGAAGTDVGDRIGRKNWWHNIPTPSALRRGSRRENYETTNYDLNAGIRHESVEMEEFDDDGGHSCISMATSGGVGGVEVLDVVSESEVYTTDQEPPAAGSGARAAGVPSGSFVGQESGPEPPEQISLFSNESNGNKRLVHEESHGDVSMSPSDNKGAEIFVPNNEGEEAANVQYYLVQDVDDNDDNDDNDDDGNDDSDDDNDIDVDNDALISVDHGGNIEVDDEVMREYHDILTEVQQLEREARAATEERTEHRRLSAGSRMSMERHREQPSSYVLRRNVQQIPLRERTIPTQQQHHHHHQQQQQRLNSSLFFANRKLFAAIESLTRTLSADHSRQFHQEMLKTAVELSNHYAAEEQQQYTAAAAAATLRHGNATAAAAVVERRNVMPSSSTATPEVAVLVGSEQRRSNDDDDGDEEEEEKSFGKVIGRRQVGGIPVRSWAIKKRPKYEE